MAGRRRLLKLLGMLSAASIVAFVCPRILIRSGATQLNLFVSNPEDSSDRSISYMAAVS